MANLSDLHTETRRLEILRVLSVDPGYRTSDALLQRALEVYGLSASRDQIRTDLAWLAEQGLVSVEALGGLHLAKLAGRGEDVAKGLARVPGVARPRPD